MKLAKYGTKEWSLYGFIALLLLIIFIYSAIHWQIWFFWVISLIVVLAWIAYAAFFRDPKRDVPTEENLILSPADGVVKDIENTDYIEYGNTYAENTTMIGIFLSVLDVHINRAPTDLTVKEIIYKKGRYYDARDKRASKENESNAVIAEAEIKGFRFPIVIKQISGAIARHIVCAANSGDRFKKGEQFGMIKFGSRTELYIPNNEKFKIMVKKGDKVKAGLTIIAKYEN